MIDADQRLLKYLHRRKPKTCVSVNKTALNSPYSLLLPIEIGNKIMHYEVNVITNLCQPLLLGLDFLSQHEVKLDFASNKLVINDEFVKIGPASFQSNIPTHVALTGELTLPPESFTLASVSVEGPTPGGGLFEPKSMLIRPLMGDRECELDVIAAWGIIDLSKDTHIIELLNPTKNPVTLPSGTPVAVEECLDPQTFQKVQNDAPTFAATTCETEEPAADGGNLPSAASTSLFDNDDNSEPKVGPGFKISLDGSLLDDQQKSDFKDLCMEYETIFAKHAHDLGKTHLMHHYIELDTDRPIRAPQYKAPPPEVRKEIDAETEELIAMGVVGESTTPYSAPITLVKKKLGGFRYCIDFRKLNNHTVKSSFPLPNINDSLRRLKKPMVISTMDLLKGYYQIPVAPAHTKFFGFSDGRRQLEHLMTPMGAKNSGATMASLMSLVFRGLPPEHILSYLDDIVVVSETVEEHFEMLRSVFKALKDAGLTCHPGKCHFFRQKATVLGFVISRDGILPDPGNLEKLEKWPIPKNDSEVRGFVGLAGYYRGHLRGFAEHATPLTDLLVKDQPFVWTENQQWAFEEIKRRLLTGTACAFPDFDKTFILKTDASDSAIGCVLAQRDERSREQMVACASRKLSTGEKRWATYDKEYVAIVWSVRHFSHYLKFRSFIVYTDHRPLLGCRSIDDEKDATGRRVRWSIELASYNIDLRHKDGKKNGDADALSRCAHADEPEEEEEVVYLGAMSCEETPAAEVIANSDKSLEEQIRAAQEADPDIKLAMQWLQSGAENAPAGLSAWYRKSKEYLLAKDGLLYSKDSKAQGNFGEKMLRIVIPYLMIGEVLHRIHGHELAGHPGETRAMARAERFFAWPTMRQDITEKVKSCKECQECRPDNRSRKVVKILPQVAKHPMHRIQADLLELPIVSHGCDHILVIEDIFTKYACFYPMAGKQSTTVAKHLWQYIRRFGCPSAWQTDNGGEFKNRLIEALTSVYGTRKEFGLAYHPQSQGQTERKNRWIIGELCRRVAQWGPRWTNYIPSLELAYNTTPHTSDGMTPHLKLFGREARTPLDAALPSPMETKDWSKNAAAYVHEHRKHLDKVHELKNELHAEYRRKMAATPRGKTQIEPYNEGDQVMRLLHLNKHKKMSVHFDGPWTVETRIDPADSNQVGNTYIIKRGDESITRPQVDLKKYVKPKHDPPAPKEPSMEVSPSLVDNAQEDQTGTLELLLAVSNLMMGIKPQPKSPALGAHNVNPQAAATVPLPSNSSPIQVIPSTIQNRNDPRGAIPKMCTPQPTVQNPTEIPNLTRLTLATPSDGVNRLLASLDNSEGIMEQRPPSESESEPGTPSGRTGSIPDVFRITGFTPTFLRELPLGQITRSPSTPTTPTNPGPSTSTPNSTRELGTPSNRPRNLKSSQIPRPRLSSAPGAIQRTPNDIASVADKRSVRELKRLQSHNRPGLQEATPDELPSSRKRTRKL